MMEGAILQACVSVAVEVTNLMQSVVRERGWPGTVALACAVVALVGCGESTASSPALSGVGSTSASTPESRSSSTANASRLPLPADGRHGDAISSAPVEDVVIEVPSLRIRLPLTIVPCESYDGTALPGRGSAFLAKCTGYYGIIASSDGPLQPLATAAPGTVIHWRDDAGKEFTRTLDENNFSADQNADGTWPGHGVPEGMPLFIVIRGAGHQVERTGRA
jgi:hypothetical protein